MFTYTVRHHDLCVSLTMVSGAWLDGGGGSGDVQSENVPMF